MSDKQFKITIAVQIIIALILIYGFFAGFATKSDIENLGGRTKSDIENLGNRTIVDFRINETRQIGAVGNSTYQTWGAKAFIYFLNSL